MATHTTTVCPADTPPAGTASWMLGVLATAVTAPRSLTNAGPRFSTFTEIDSDAVAFPPPSRATAASVCGPAGTVVESQTTEYGAVVSSVPRFAPSTLNCTPTTPMSSLAEAVTSAGPVTV